MKVWQGGFLDMAGELVNRGNRGLRWGMTAARFLRRARIPAGATERRGPAGRLSFKASKFGGSATFNEALSSREDQLPRIAKVDAHFLGYSRDSATSSAPVFRYRVGKNDIQASTAIAANGELTVRVRASW